MKNKQEGGIEFTTELCNSIEIADLKIHGLKLKNKTTVNTYFIDPLLIEIRDQKPEKLEK